MKYLFTFFIIFLISFTLNADNPHSNESVLASGEWFKVASEKQGIHKITYSQLRNWGIEPQNVAIYSNGGYMLPVMNNEYCPDDLTKIPVLHSKDHNGSDAIYFYSTGSTEWKYNTSSRVFEHTEHLFDNKTYFFITSDHSKSTTPTEAPNSPESASATFNFYDDYQVYQQKNINLLNSGNIWYSERLMPNATKTHVFNFPKAQPNSNGIIVISGTAASSAASRLNVKINNNSAGSLEFISRSRTTAVPVKGIWNFNSASDLKIDLNYNIDAPNGECWIEHITINLKSKLIFDGSQLAFRNAGALNHPSIAYSINSSSSNAVIWDISKPLAPQNVQFTKAGTQITFSDINDNELKEYVIFNPESSKIPQPQYIGKVKNQNIQGLPEFNMIIVTHPDFIEPSETLAEFHRQNDKLKVLVLETTKIYNEFSSGIPDAAAIRNMARMFYERGKKSGTPLRYLLLMGSGSYNNHLHNGTVNNHIPTYQSGTIGSGVTHNFMSDDFFAILGENEGALIGDLSLGIGRIPATTVQEAQIVVEKNISYLSPETHGEWKNRITFLADDGDNNRHMIDSERIISAINDSFPGFIFNKIYFDAYPLLRTSGADLYPDVNNAIARSIEEGTLLFNYIGHANSSAVADERVLMISDVLSWSNQNRLPVFVTATCKFSPFDDDKKSIGEEILFNPAGGAVALFSTTRDVYPGANFQLSRNFYRNIFKKDENGENLRMGEIMRLAKNASSGDRNNNRSFTLLGNPALKLAFPELVVKTTTINGIPIGDTITIGALEKVTIEGIVTDALGNIMENYNGDVISHVYDKELNIQTLGNRGASTRFEFPIRDNIIYKGLSTVSNGRFSFSFVVPKDILYNTGEGKIFYYTSNGTIDGNGSSDEFFIGGSGENPTIDNTPPEIEVFMNNDKFRSGDKVSSSALLMVRFYDESGINTVGTGIGHDIVAILNGDHSNPIILNDYYKTQANTYQRGTVLYPLNNLEPGEHVISVKAWDVHNNSNTREISFFVEEGFEIIDVHNSPNPVRYHTTFNISHNLPGDIFDIEAEIFNLSGKKVAHVQETAGSYGTTETKIRWDTSNTLSATGTDKILVYRITMTNRDGLKASRGGKLIMNNF